MGCESRYICEWIDRPARPFTSLRPTLRVYRSGRRGLGAPWSVFEGEWFVETPVGRVGFAFVPPERVRVLDHEVTLRSGEVFNNPMRVVPDGGACEVVFTLRRQQGTANEEFEPDAAAVAADLATLNRLLESRQAASGRGRPS